MAARPRLFLARLLSAALLLTAAAWGCAEARPSRPERVVLIVADTLRRDFVSAYAERPPVPTPHLQQLAERGTLFSNAIASFHQTTMSMSAIFTGRTPSLETGDPTRVLPWTRHAWCGMARLASSADDSCIPAQLDTLAEDLRAAGFETIGVVSNRLLFQPLGYEQGFDTWIEVGEAELQKDKQSRRRESQTRAGDRVNDRVFAALDARRSDRFFLYVHYIDPHEYGVRVDLPRYADGVRYLDTVVGELLAGLESRGLSEDTAIIFTSDHGERLDEEHALPATPKHFGNPSFEPLVRVPLIVVPPVDRDASALVRSQDLRGLVAEVAGLVPPTRDGDPDLAPDEVFLTEQFFQTYRRGRFKSTWSRDGKQSALFDLESDPEEKKDRSALHPEVVAAHRARIAELTRSLGSRHGQDAELTPEDAERLRALGYLD